MEAGNGNMGEGMMMGGHMKHGWTHMTFFQGKNSEILFQGWPGRNGGGMYAVALVFVFVMGFLVEWITSWGCNRNDLSRPLKGLLETIVHALKVGLAYLLMLAVMSFNVGVLLVAIGGRALGFFLFGSALRSKNNTVKPNPPQCEC